MSNPASASVSESFPVQLHLQTRPLDLLARELRNRLELQQSGSDGLVRCVEWIDLTDKTPKYSEIVERIFRSESVVTW